MQNILSHTVKTAGECEISPHQHDVRVIIVDGAVDVNVSLLLFDVVRVRSCYM